MSTISFYPNALDKNFSVASPESVMQGIVSGQWAEWVNYLQTLGKNEYKDEKKKTPAVTWSGIFKPGTRAIDDLTVYSGLVCLDIDGLDPSAITSLKDQLKDDPYVKFCFVSPSGKGIKIIVEVDSEGKDHRAAWLHLQDYYEKNFLVKLDVSGKDVSRLCFISFDPGAIIKKNEVFKVDLKYGEIITTHTPQVGDMKAVHDHDRVWRVVKHWVENCKSKFQYVEGQRNVYIHAVACAMNRLGVDIETTIRLITAHLPVPDTKWHQSVRSAYLHNNHEHNSVQLQDVGGAEFVPPVFIMDKVDDVAARDLMTITALLSTYNVPYQYMLDIVSKIGNYYQNQKYIDLSNGYLHVLMNEAIKTMKQNMAVNIASSALQYESAEDIGKAIVELDMVSGLVKTHIPPIDEAMFGGIMPGSFFAFIGLGKTYKSVIAQFMTYMNAMNDIPTLYLNGEMSSYQFYERLVLMAMGHDLRQLLHEKRITPENIQSFINDMQEITKKNVFVVNGHGFNQNNIYSTVQHIESTTGKKIKLIVVDGVTQMDAAGREEIPATIHNTGVLKEVAKQTNAAVIGLLHLSGDAAAYTLRDTGEKARGGIKTIGNLDGYFSTSLCIDPHGFTLNDKDVKYLPNKIYLRLVDKRTRTGTVSVILNVDQRLHIHYEPTNPEAYEVKREKQRY